MMEIENSSNEFTHTFEVFWQTIQKSPILLLMANI